MDYREYLLNSVDSNWEMLSESRPDHFVYILFLGELPVYAGSTISIRDRVVTHKKEKKFDRVMYLDVTAEDRIDLEHGIIKLLRPPLNKEQLMADDPNDAEIAALEKYLLLRPVDEENGDIPWRDRCGLNNFVR